MPQERPPLPRRRLAAIVIAVFLAPVLGFTLSSCSSFTNKGGDTTCGAFIALNADQRKDTVIQMLRDRNQSTNDPNVTVALASSLLFCQTLAKETDPISKMYGAGASATP
jgi:urease accessory protein UreH